MRVTCSSQPSSEMECMCEILNPACCAPRVCGRRCTTNSSTRDVASLVPLDNRQDQRQRNGGPTVNLYCHKGACRIKHETELLHLYQRNRVAKYHLENIPNGFENCRVRLSLRQQSVRMWKCACARKPKAHYFFEKEKTYIVRLPFLKTGAFQLLQAMAFTLKVYDLGQDFSTLLIARFCNALRQCSLDYRFEPWLFESSPNLRDICRIQTAQAQSLNRTAFPWCPRATSWEVGLRWPQDS